MYAIIGEDLSDTQTIKCILRRLIPNSSGIKTKGYEGCAQMLRKASAQIKSFASDHHCSRFIISYDADHDDPTIRRQVIVDRVIQPASVNGAFCALVPTQEIEAWILADLSAVSRVIQNWNYAGQFHHPEAIDDPKETLERLCKEYGRPRYIHAVHNEKVAAYLDFDVVACKCPSFRPLLEFVRTGKSNC